MKLTNFFTESYNLSEERSPDPKVVAKFADVDAKHRSYYIMKWAEEKGMDGDDAMELAGYVKDGYIGAGAWNWRYVGLDEDKQRLDPKCWKGYKKQGTKMKGGVRVNNCVKEAKQALARHVKEGVPLPDSLFRYQSDAYFDTFKYAKQLREAGILQELDWESEEMLGTDIGESVELKGVGRVWLDVPYLDESEDDDVNDSGMIGEPDQYYDEEERKQAYNDLQDALDNANRLEHDYVVDGICPECGGSSYMDGDYEGDEDSCYGWGNYGCDEGEMEGATWKEIMDHDKRQAERQALKDKPQPSDEELENAMKQLHTEYVKSGKMNAFELPSILRQMYPEISKPKAREIGAKFLKSFGESMDQGSSEGEAMVAKMLAKALGDENRWTEMSVAELYAELESTEPKKADMIALVAKMLYDVRLEENKLPEAEYQGKDVELNKPKRGGSKKYYVYVKNPKTGKVKKISFGDPGLKTKSGNKGRAKSFAARHNCEKKNDKTKAGYWACRLPRYGLVKGGKWW
jgi:hypothetical protein